MVLLLRPVEKLQAPWCDLTCFWSLTDLSSRFPKCASRRRRCRASGQHLRQTLWAKPSLSEDTKDSDSSVSTELNTVQAQFRGQGLRSAPATSRHRVINLLQIRAQIWWTRTASKGCDQHPDDVHTRPATLGRNQN